MRSPGTERCSGNLPLGRLPQSMSASSAKSSAVETRAFDRPAAVPHAKRAIRFRVVIHDRHAVPGDLHVEFERRHAQFERGPEGRHRVLGVPAAPATVSLDVQRAFTGMGGHDDQRSDDDRQGHSRGRGAVGSRISWQTSLFPGFAVDVTSEMLARPRRRSIIERRRRRDRRTSRAVREMENPRDRRKEHERQLSLQHLPGG